GTFDDPPQLVADQPDRQGQGQFTTQGLLEDSGHQTGVQGMDLQFGDQALEAQDQPAIGRGRVVDAVLVTDEARTVSTQIKELIPIGAIARQPGDVVGEDDAHLLVVDQGHQFLEAAPPCGGASGPPEVGVDHADVAGVPAGGTGAVLEVILELEALLIGQDLVWGRLADVDHGEATEVIGGDNLGYTHEKSP